MFQPQQQVIRISAIDDDSFLLAPPFCKGHHRGTQKKKKKKWTMFLGTVSYFCSVGCFQMKLAILEQKLLKEEHERKLVQEKAEEVSPR